MATILVGCDDGLLDLAPNGEQRRVDHEGRHVTAAALQGRVLWTVLDGREIWRTDGDGGRVRHAGTIEHGLRANCLAETRSGMFVGTSEAHLLELLDRGGEYELRRVKRFEDAEGRSEWHTPWGGPPDVRSISSSVSEDTDTVYVNVHVGGIVRTNDTGERWEPTIDIHTDVHRVLAIPGRTLAACARGLAVSDDRGDSWEMRTDGLHATYCRGVAVSGDTVFVSASVGPHGGRSAVYRAPLDGGEFDRCVKGLPDWFGDNVDSAWLDAAPGLVAFGTSDGLLFVSEDDGASWREIAKGISGLHCVLVEP